MSFLLTVVLKRDVALVAIGTMLPGMIYASIRARISFSQRRQPPKLDIIASAVKEGGEDDLKYNQSSPRFTHYRVETTRSTQSLVFSFAIFAQHLAVGIHFEANLFVVLLNDRFKIGAFLFPAYDGSALGLCLGSRLHRGRDFRAVDSLSLMFLFLRRPGKPQRHASRNSRYCD